MTIDRETVPALTTFTFLIGCFLGAFAVSYLADLLGRKRSILAGGATFLVGGIIQTLSSAVSVFED